MANHLAQILKQWAALRDDTEWVIGTVYSTEGSSYRKAGAMMMFSGLGHQLGLLSGGCLESDIQRHARRVMATGRPLHLKYDGNDEDDISFQLGIGCGGVVRIVLQPVGAVNQYLHLDRVLAALEARQTGYYTVDLSHDAIGFGNRFESGPVATGKTSKFLSETGRSELTIPVRPTPHLLIAGGGVDARPLSRLAGELGWAITVWDPRPANARPEFFETATHLVRGDIAELTRHTRQHPIDAGVIMTHSVSLDVAALTLVADLTPDYLALLGPTHRRDEVVEKAGLRESEVIARMAGPAGLDLGGDLPETIALAILAECQARMSRRSGASLSLQLTSTKSPAPLHPPDNPPPGQPDSAPPPPRIAETSH